MNRREVVEELENKWRAVVGDMFLQGVISHRQQKSLNQKISVWCYDKTHEPVREGEQ